MTRNECKADKKLVKSSGEGICAALSENNECNAVLDCFLAPKVCRSDENLRLEDEETAAWLCDGESGLPGVVGAVGERMPSLLAVCFWGVFLLRPVKERRKDHSDSNWTESRDEEGE